MLHAGRWIRFVLPTVLAGGFDCGPVQPRPTQDGTARMADTLALLYRQALANPAANPFLNEARAEQLQARVAFESGNDALNTRMALGMERLMAGHSREALADFEVVRKGAGLDPDHITPRTKPFFDLEAIAWLRIGEQQNCLDNPAANICIIPFDGPAKHQREEGARAAIERYRSMVRQFPGDRGSQWLLNVAYMAVGEYPDKVPRALLIPGLARPHPSAFPEFQNIAGSVDAAVNGLAGGLDIADFNGDGLLDVFTTSMGITDPPHLLLADGHGRFTDATARAGLKGINGGLNTLHADYDNDGDEDILVLRGAWMGEAGRFPSSLLRNRGDGTFEDVTFQAGLLSLHPTQAAAWADFNLDGYLDLFIGNESQAEGGGPSHPSKLFVSNRNGTFTEVASAVGIDLDAFVKSVAWGDVDNDGLPDLFVSVLFGPNRLYMNRGGKSIKDWRFEERGESAGVQQPMASFGSWFWDYDQDGWQDLLVLSYDIRASGALHEAVAREYLGLPATVELNGSRVQVEHTRLFHNNRDGTFSDASAKTGLDRKVIYSMGANFGDLDNDGWLDFYVGTGNPDYRSVIPNRMFRSVKGARFEEVTLPGGFGHIQKGHATAFADLDRDGDEDIYMVLGGAYQGDRATSVLFENPGWKHRSWITLLLEGKTANRSAIGARVEIDAVDAAGAVRTLRRTVGTGGHFGAGPLDVHVGLGSATRVTAIRVTWPDSARSKTVAASVTPNAFYRLVQGAEPQVVDRPAVPFRKIPMAMPHRAP
jgi:hypothetical protein